VRDVAFAERNWHVYQLHERAVRHGDWLYIWNAWPDRHNVCGESSSFDLFPAARELWEAAEQGQLTDAQKLLTLPQQPQEMLFNVKRDPYQFTNLAGSPEQAKVLGQMRGLLAEWKGQTGDCVQQNPTPSRQPLHEESKSKVVYGEFPGAANNATKINRPGPIAINEG
jgi:arylsulfatase